MDDFIEIHITTSTRAEAQEIGGGLVDNGLAACAQVMGSIESIYRWEEEVCREEEFLLIVKTVKPLFEDVAEFTRERHSYEVPQIISVPITNGTEDYLDWIRDNTRG